MIFGDNFLLNTETSRELYKKYAADTPIYDFHCHLPPREIYEDLEFCDITYMWLQFDHYKWRALRYAGVPEEYITGDAGSWEKFQKWAEVCEKLAGCPLNHWANLELRMYFGVKEPLTAANARKVYDYCNEVIKKEHLSPRKMLERAGVKLVCTTDDPVDSLEWHRKFAAEGCSFEMRPAFRPDKALDIAKTAQWQGYMKELSAASGMAVKDFDSLVKALAKRLDHFVENGCLITDHSLSSLMVTDICNDKAEAVFKKAMAGEALSACDCELFRNTLMRAMGREYSSRGLVMQLHIGAVRNCNTRMFQKLGPDAGYDIMGDFEVLEPVRRLLDSLEIDSRLPKTVLYCLNQKDTHVLGSLPQCFCEDNVPGKVQLGVPWWHLDNKKGIEYHFETMSNEGMLANSIGMLTDSRSFLSYARHYYYRRLLCRYFGELIENEEFAATTEAAGEIVRDICCRNVKAYLGL